MTKHSRAGLLLLFSGIAVTAFAAYAVARGGASKGADGPPTALTLEAIAGPNAPSPAVISTKAGPEDRARLARFEQEVEILRRRLKVPGISAVIVRNGEPLWTKGFGYADLEKHVPATPETLYHVASLTKTFASMLLMQVVEQGKLDLDAPMSRYSPDFKDDTVKVKHLLSHTSQGTPGERYQYSGNRYNYLTAVLEKETGKTYRELVASTFLRPLKMTGSVPGQDVLDEAGAVSGEDGKLYRQNLKSLAQPYRLYGGAEVVHALYPPRKMGTAAGLLSTVVDMAKYDAAIDSHAFIAPETQERAWTPFVSNAGRKLPHGLGWFVEEYRGTRLVWHYGNWGSGFSAMYLKIPEKRLTLIVIANSEALSDAFYYDGVMNSPLGLSFLRLFLSEGALGHTVPAPNWSADAEGVSADLARLRKQTPDYDYQREESGNSALRRWLDAGRRRAREAVKVEPKSLEAYVGRYELNPRRTFTVRRAGAALTIDIPKDGEAEMYAEADGRFFLKVTDLQASFVRDDAGRVTGLEIVTEGQVLKAKRVE